MEINSRFMALGYITLRDFPILPNTTIWGETMYIRGIAYLGVFRRSLLRLHQQHLNRNPALCRVCRQARSYMYN